MQGLVAFVRTLGATRLAAMTAVTISLVAFFAFLIVRVTAPHMSTLYTDLSAEDSGAVIKELEREGVDYQLKYDGSTILVPQEKVARLRIKLAESGVPKGGGVGYEIFDKSDALGATSFIQNINRLRALEGELARTIRAIDRVQMARVHLVLPDRPLFSRETIEPSASIVLKVRGSLEPQQVRAIRHLVATAVSGLKPERISIVDETGRLLADGAGTAADGGEGGAEERKTAFERRMRQQVETIVSSVVGPGRARVEVAADFDFNRITQTSNKYDPEGRVVRSSQTREETTAAEGARDGQVTVANELPGGGGRTAQAGAPGDQNKKTEEIVNYEVSHTTKTEVIEGGRLKRISVAVLVDGTYAKSDKGQLTYQPRSKEDIDRISSLVRTAIGFDQKRGDQVEVVNLRFAEAPPVPFTENTSWLSMLQVTKEDIMRAIETLVMGLLGLVVLLLVVRPLVRRMITPDDVRAVGNVVAGAIGGGGGESPGSAAAGPVSENFPLEPSETAKMIDVAQVQGQVHAQSIQKVGEIAQKNPQETVSIIRQWLHEPAA